MSDFVVGPGVQAAMDAAGDEARSDERYIIFDAGHQVSMTFGRDAVWNWTEEDNRVNRLPFS